MSKLNMTKAIRRIKTAFGKHSPEILTGIGIAGMITTTILAVRATPKALILIEKKKKERETEKLPPVELIKTTWTCYIPAAVTSVVSISCLLGASSVNIRRNAALATAYSLSESALRDYREKVVETIGEKKEHVIRDTIAKDKVEQNPLNFNEIIITEKGDTLCYDVISGRYFKSDIEKLRKIQNELNRQMIDESFISLNEFYYAIGLSGIRIGDDLGWEVNKGLIDLYFTSQLAENEQPCLVLDYHLAPQYDYRRW